MILKLTEQHIIKSNEWKHWCIKAKNLYNHTLYYWRQSIFGNIKYFSEYEIVTLFREFDDDIYRDLPSHCGQQIIKKLFENINSWQKARKEYQKDPSKFLGKPKMPKYKKELSILCLSQFQIMNKDGHIHFPKKMNMAPIKTKIPKYSKICDSRVIPRSNYFIVEIVYEVNCPEVKQDNGNYLGVDLGINNFATCVSNTGESFIINGRPIKSINQLYNKRKASMQSKLPFYPRVDFGKKIQRINSGAICKVAINRNNKIKNYIHSSSKFIIDRCIKNNINTIIVGNNKNWKNEVNLGTKTNQNFVSIPYCTLIEQLEYKCKLAGLNFAKTEESYTSKCSFLDLEPIGKHEKYVGKRVKRGLFRTEKGYKINADANGSGNIIRKVFGDLLLGDSIVRAVIAPEKLLPFKQLPAILKCDYSKKEIKQYHC